MGVKLEEKEEVQTVMADSLASKEILPYHC